MNTLLKYIVFIFTLLLINFIFTNNYSKEVAKENGLINKVLWQVKLYYHSEEKILKCYLKKIELFSNGKLESNILLNRKDRVIKGITVGDIDSSGSDKIFVLIGVSIDKKAEEIVLVSYNNGKLIEEKSWKQESCYPWKVCVADIDNDGKKEVIIGVKVLSRISKKYVNQLNICEYEDGKLYEKWFCARDFIDFGFMNIGNEQKLLTVEKINKTEYALISYKWEGFGYWQDKIIDINTEQEKLIKLSEVKNNE